MSTNYTLSQETLLKELYQANRNSMSNDEVFTIIRNNSSLSDKNDRSLRSKLSRMGIYVPDDKTRVVNARDGLPDKKIMLSELQKVSGLNGDVIECFLGVNKRAIYDLLQLIKHLKEGN